MALTPGTKLGPYEIQSPPGAGGMGEVYRARDTRLDRTVAIKILPAQFSNDGRVGSVSYVVRNLREGAVADAIFELPAGYAKYQGQWKP